MRRIFFVFSVALALFLGAATVSRAAEVHGVVLDSVSAQPVPNARVSVVGTDLTTASAPDGTFDLDVADWPATIAVARPGYRVARIAAEVPAAQPIEIRLDPIISYADRIEVTASRAREGVDPVTFTNIPQEQIQDANWGQDPAMMLPELAPGFLAYNDSGNGIGYSYFTVRGFGQARTRVTLSGAPLNDAESGELFFIDLADFLSTAGDVQLRRGVFGLSGIGGSVDITTTPSRLEPSFRLEGETGSFATHRLVADYDSGLVGGTWSLVARYSKIQSDGYRDQSWVDMWNSFLSATRYGSRSTLRFITFGGPERTHLAYYGIPKSTLDGGLTGNADRDRRFNPLSYPGELDDFVQPHFQIVHDFQINEATRLSQTLYAFRGDGSYTQLRHGTLGEYRLPDVVFPDGTTISESDLVRKRTVGEWDLGWVPTFSHTRGPLTVTVAAELRFHQAHHWGEVRWAQYYPVGIAPDHRYYDYRVDKQTATGALRLAWDATSRLTLSGGLELSHQRYKLSDDVLGGVSFAQPYDFLLPRLGAIFHLAKDTNLYVNVARGGREPNFSQIYDPEDYYSVPALGLKPEDVIDYEAGISAQRPTWLARVNGFFMDFRNEIVYAGALDDNGVPIYGNGARSHHMGVEAEGEWNPCHAFGVQGHVTLSRNTFTHYQEFGWDGGEVSYDGNRIAGYPDVMGAVTVHGTAGPVTLRLTAQHVGRFYLDNTQDNRSNPEARSVPGYVPAINPAYTVAGASLEVALPGRCAHRLSFSSLGIQLRANNIFDRRYTTFGYMDGEPQFTPAATRSFYAGLELGL